MRAARRTLASASSAEWTGRGADGGRMRSALGFLSLPARGGDRTTVTEASSTLLAVQRRDGPRLLPAAPLLKVVRCEAWALRVSSLGKLEPELRCTGCSAAPAGREATRNMVSHSSAWTCLE